MPNRLANETSPYLLQHQDNPVDWHPWGEEALARARTEDRPLLVSIGYSACHWCHVMEHESFEDPEIAALMNEHFVCIKVDREERPDVDAIYMDAVQAMTGQGGWPLNAFITPEQVPFYAGTYFPPEQRHGMPSWRTVLLAVADAWDRRRDEIRASSEQVVRSLEASTRMEPSTELIRGELLDRAIDALRRSYDRIHGGFGGAPKFPPASAIELLLSRGEHEMSLATLRAMAAGGIYDQVGGGFARYAVDATWTVPHFEKMLYDNALLARAYLHGWQVSGEERLRSVCCETLDWALREMRGPEGGFCAALDADSEGVEGKFYVWTVEQLRGVLGPELAEAAIAHFGASEPGNFEATNILEARGPEPPSLPEIRRKLYAARSERVRPGLDDKRLTAWNALMISALADAGAVLEREDYLQAAVACAEFVLRDLRDDRGRLLRTWKEGRGRLGAYLEDHAFLLEGLLTLYEATFDLRWYERAVGLAGQIIDHFADRDRGGFFMTPDDHEQLAARRKDLDDSPIPSGSSSAAFGLLRLARLSGEQRYEQHAVGVLRLLYPLAAKHPHGFGHLLRAVDFYLAPVKEVVIVGPAAGRAKLLRVIRSQFRPHIVLSGRLREELLAKQPGSASEPVAEQPGSPSELLAPQEGSASELLAKQPGSASEPVAVYVCEHFTCRAPVTEPEELAALLA